MYTVYLAIWFALSSNVQEPVILAAFKTVDDCQIEAQKINTRNEKLQTKEAKAVGAQAVCLVVKKDIV